MQARGGRDEELLQCLQVSRTSQLRGNIKGYSSEKVNTQQHQQKGATQCVKRVSGRFTQSIKRVDPQDESRSNHYENGHNSRKEEEIEEAGRRGKNKTIGDW